MMQQQHRNNTHDIKRREARERNERKEWVEGREETGKRVTAGIAPVW